jgi:hypothetical protein
LDVREWKREIHGEPLPLSSKSTLAWAGYVVSADMFELGSFRRKNNTLNFCVTTKLLAFFTILTELYGTVRYGRKVLSLHTKYN